MNDDWRPSNYKPRGGWRAMLPGWRVVLVALVAAGVFVARMLAHDVWESGEGVSFNVMKIVAGLVAMACVAPSLFSGKRPPGPGQFPTERRDDGAPHDDKNP